MSLISAALPQLKGCRDRPQSAKLNGYQKSRLRPRLGVSVGGKSLSDKALLWSDPKLPKELMDQASVKSEDVTLLALSACA